MGSSAVATATAGREVAAAVVAVLAGAAAVDGGPAGTAPAAAPAAGAGNFAASRGHGLAGGTSRGPAAGPPTSTLARWSTPSGPGGRAAACAVLGGPNGRSLKAGPVQTSAHHHPCLGGGQILPQQSGHVGASATQGVPYWLSVSLRVTKEACFNVVNDPQI